MVWFIGYKIYVKWNRQKLRFGGLNSQRLLNSKCSNYIISVREQLKELTTQYEKSENDLKALQSVGQVGNGVRDVEGDGDLFF